MCFEHDALSCNSTAIRILTLHAGSFENDLRCSLFESQQPHETPFDALSYTWGSSARRKSIFVNGSSFQITSNLELALRYIRHPDEPRNLWIDAICINQSNSAEKSVQVQLMREIYAGAQSVIVWLGEEADEAKVVMEHLEALWVLEGRPTCVVGLGDTDSSSEEISTGWEKGYLESSSVQAKARDWMNSDPAFTTAMDAFFSRPWWSRAWVVQEIAQARKARLHCGSLSLSWTSLESFFAKRHQNTIMFLLLPQLNHPRFLNFNKASQLVISRISNLIPDIGLKASLFSNLSYLSHTQATDARDKVYCLLGLKTNMNHSIIPDYNKSVREVYIDATKAILEFDYYSHIDSIFNHEARKSYKQFTLNVICKVNRMGDEPAKFELPSWVPDFSIADIPWDLVKSYDRVQAFRAAGEYCTTTFAPKIEDSAALVISAHFWDSITEITDALSHTRLESSDWEQLLRGWIPSSLQSKPYPTGEPAEDAFWRTLVQDRPSSEQTIRLHEPDKPRYRAEFRSWANSSSLSYSSPPESKPVSFQGDESASNANQQRLRAVRYPSSSRKQGSIASPNTDFHGPISFQALLPRLAGWRFCVTSKGYFGTVPAAVQSGDLIILARGSCVPLVVRKLLDAKVDEYSLVGAAYVHGIMDGEVVDQFGARCKEIIKLL